MDADAQIDPSQVQWDGPDSVPANPPVSADAIPDPSQVQWDDTIAPLPGNPKDFSHSVVGAVDAATTGVLNAPHAIGEAGKDLYRRVESQVTGQPIDKSPSWVDSIPTTTPTPEETNLESRIAANPVVQGTANAIKSTVGDVMDPAEAGDIVTLATAGLPVAGKFMRTGEAVAAPIAETVTDAEKPTAEAVLAQTAKTGDAGAAAVPPSLDNASPDTRAAIEGANGVHVDAVNRHLNTDALPMPEGETAESLTKGQATRDTQQASDEWNMRGDSDTQGILTRKFDNQNATQASSLGEIRRRANPTLVGQSTESLGQQGVDAIKTQDNAAVLDTRAKYKALADAAGGVMPLDTGTAANDINAELAAKLKTKVAADDPTISEVMDSLKSGQPMTFDTFNNAISNLSEVQRARTPASAAAGIVRSHLESMPMSAHWDQLQYLRNQASSAAKSRFDMIDQNPAYAAVVNDNVPRLPNGLHDVGAPSPLADSFMDKFATGNGQTASKAYLARLKGVMKNNPDFSPLIEAASLNKLRGAAGLDQFDTPVSGVFKSGNFKNTWNGMQDKAPVLMRPQTISDVDKLHQYTDDVSFNSKASTKNWSNTAPTLQRFGAMEIPKPSAPAAQTVGQQILGHGADVVSDLALAHTVPAALPLKKFGLGILKGNKQAAEKVAQDAAKEAAIQSQKDAKLKFAKDATAPGAGIDLGQTPAAAIGAPPVTARATGGRVDHEALTEKLFQRWKQAQKHADKATEPLLGLPDSTVAKALKIAQRAQI